MKRIISTLMSMMIMTVTSFAQNQTVTPATLWQMGRVSLCCASQDGNTALYSVTRYDVDANKGTSTLYTVNTDTGTSTAVTDGKTSAQGVGFTKNGKVAYISDGQLWTVSLDGTSPVKASDIACGITGAKISSDGGMIVFTADVKIKQTPSEMYPQYPKANVRIMDDLMYRHWNYWVGDAVSHVFFASFDGEKVTGTPMDIMQGEPFESPLSPFGGMEQIAVSPFGDKIAYTSKKKVGTAAATSTDSDIYIYDIATKKTTDITEGNKGYDTNPSWSADGRFIAFSSMDEDGYEADKNDIKIYEFATGKTYNLTSAWDETIEEFAWAGADKIMFRTTVEAVEQLFMYTLPKDLGKVDAKKSITTITHLQDSCVGSFIPNGKKVIVTLYDFNRPAEVFSYDVKKDKYTALTDVNGDIFSKIKPVGVQKRWVKTTDGKQMLVWVLLPPDFDSTKKYPSVLFCGGGPQNAITPSYSFRWNFQLMASEGYVVVVPNRRGLPSFGTKWNEEISGQWGAQAITDLMTAMDDVSKESYVDETKLGAVGASYGGYSVFMLAGKHEGRFKAFIAHCGTFDTRSWYMTTEEIFFAHKDMGGAYWEDKNNPSYNEFSPSSYVDRWDTPILIIQGEKDFRVPENQSMQAFQAARLRGVEARYVSFPDECHWVLKPQNSLLWHDEFYAWLKKYLK